MMDRLQYLLEAYFDASATADEMQELRALLAAQPNGDAVFTRLAAVWTSRHAELEAAPGFDERTQARIVASILAGQQNKTIEPEALVIPMHRRNRTRYAVAAAVIGIMAVAGWWFFGGEGVKKDNSTPLAKTDIQAPASNRASIKLANGQTVYLDSASNGQLAAMGSVTLVKLADGKIAYNGSAGEVSYNTISNPRGSRVIDLVLTDGSHVWLNAGSSMTYPVPMSGSTRNVSIDGEAYFEVAKDASRPFTVSHGETKVTVLGTHFNVNAYDNEPELKVTLLEGSVKVNKGAMSSLLKPGEQAQVAEQIRLSSDVDTDAVMAWKNGQFAFHGASIAMLLREVERWYDIEVEVKGSLPARTFTLDGSRTMKLSELLRGFEVNHIPYSIDGEHKKLVVNP